MDPKDRKALELFRDTLVLSESRMYEHVSTTFRWLMATLFAANGGAIVALMSGSSPPPGSSAALAWFAAGTVLSLVMGITSAFSGYRAANALWNVRAQVEHGLLTDTLPKEVIEDFTTKQKRNWKTFIPSDVGLASLACFVAGIATMSRSLIG